MSQDAKRKALAEEKRSMRSKRYRAEPEDLLGLRGKTPRRVSVKISRKYDLASAFNEAIDTLYAAASTKKKTRKARSVPVDKYTKVISKLKKVRTSYPGPFVRTKPFPRKSKKRATKPSWMRRNIRRPGRYRRLMEEYGWAIPGERIPADIKEAGCLDPETTYKFLFNRKVKNARLFQKQSCLARTFKDMAPAHRGPGKRHHAESRSWLNLKVHPNDVDGLYKYLKKHLPSNMRFNAYHDSVSVEYSNENQRIAILVAFKDFRTIHGSRRS